MRPPRHPSPLPRAGAARAGVLGGGRGAGEGLELAVSESLSDAALFLSAGWYVNVPLESTYTAAWAAVPHSSATGFSRRRPRRLEVNPADYRRG